MIEDAIIEHIVIPNAMSDLGAYIVVGTIGGIMFIAYHLTTRIDNRIKERNR